MTEEFDIDIDEMGTMVFCTTENRWRGSDSYEPEGFGNTGKDAFAFKSGELWIQNVSGGQRNLLFGLPVTSAIGIVSRADAGKIKRWLTASIEANIAPSNATFRTTLPKAQSTRLRGSKFQPDKDGIFYASILRAGGGEKIITGNRLTGPFMYCLFEFDTRTPIQLRFINIGYKLSAGHEFV
jgi:hypothetical protein